MPDPILPAALLLRDGAAFSERYDDTYWSISGGLAETHHVFLSGNDLPARWAKRTYFNVLETGFGAGLNFLCTWQSWREAAAPDARLHYVAVDLHPFRRDDLAKIHALWPQLAPLSQQLLARYPPLIPGFHRLHLEGGRVTLTLLWGEATHMLSQLTACIDAFFLDGFAPSRNPAMWCTKLYAQLARLAAADATLASYTVAGEVRRGLASAGFVVEKRAGYGSKREMLAARRGGAAAISPVGIKHAIVIGAGIAGTLCAERLATRGWRVDLIERRDAPARETSGNPAGVLQPMLAADWNRLSRATLEGFYYALRLYADLDARGLGLVWQQCGVLKLARDEQDAMRQQRIVQSGVLPDDVLRLVDRDTASQLAGWETPTSGWWFPDGCWVHPPSLCGAALRAGGDAIRLHTQRNAIQLTHGESDWQVWDEAGTLIAEAPLVILANGHLARRYARTEWLPLRPMRGQVTYLPAQAGPDVRTVVAREGYITPATPFGVHVIGATYEENSTDTTVREEDHRANLERLNTLLPALYQNFAATRDAAPLTGRAGIRCVGPDRMPVVGAIPHSAEDSAAQPGLYGLLGLGSRGLVFAPLLAELLASQLNNEPHPVETELAVALSFTRLCSARPKKT